MYIIIYRCIYIYIYIYEYMSKRHLARLIVAAAICVAVCCNNQSTYICTHIYIQEATGPFAHGKYIYTYIYVSL